MEQALVRGNDRQKGPIKYFLFDEDADDDDIRFRCTIECIAGKRLADIAISLFNRDVRIKRYDWAP